MTGPFDAPPGGPAVGTPGPAPTAAAEARPTKAPRGRKRAATPKAPREPRSARASRREGSSALLVPASSFDFLEGKFRATARIRLMNVLVAGVLAIAVVAVAAQAVSRQLEMRSSESTLTAAQTQLARLDRDIAAKQIGGGGTVEEVGEHIKQRIDQAAGIAQDQLQYSTVVKQIMSLSAPGVTIIGISFGPSTDPAVLGNVSVTGQATQLDGANPIIDALSDPKRFPYLVADDVASQGTSTTCREDNSALRVCQWSWSGQLNDKARATRAEDITKRYTPTTSTTAPGGTR